jgi:hypothetical protein
MYDILVQRGINKINIIQKKDGGCILLAFIRFDYMCVYTQALGVYFAVDIALYKKKALSYLFYFFFLSVA